MTIKGPLAGLRHLIKARGPHSEMCSLTWDLPLEDTPPQLEPLELIPCNCWKAQALTIINQVEGLTK